MSNLMVCLALAAQATPATMPPDSWLKIPDSRMRSVAPVTSGTTSPPKKRRS